jgi:hypothetical protein
MVFILNVAIWLSTHNNQGKENRFGCLCLIFTAMLSMPLTSPHPPPVRSLRRQSAQICDGYSPGVQNGVYIHVPGADRLPVLKAARSSTILFVPGQ